MKLPRKIHTATLLPSGKVLIVGGQDNNSSEIGSTEVYDPATGAWSSAAPLSVSREHHTATLLPDGRVLVVGGYKHGQGPITSAEVYDPATGAWSRTGSLFNARYGHTATMLPDGKVLVTGGFGPGSILSSAELYDPATGAWSLAQAMVQLRYRHTATLLPNGKVLVVGGYKHGGSTIASAEMYDPATGTWSFVAPMAQSRVFHTATLLPNGKLLVVGGSTGSVSVASAELFDPATWAWVSASPLAQARAEHSATLLGTGRVLVAGGYGPSGDLASAEITMGVIITTNPPNPSNQATATFTFSAADASSSLECSLDGAAFGSCTSPKEYSALAEGSHTFKVQARDAAGNLDPTPATYSWLIDLTAPETSITTKPSSLSNQTPSTFTFTATEAGSSFECRLDGAAFSSCSSPKAYAALGDGSHTFEVRARDSAGNLDPTPATYSWTLDLTAPEASITTTPPHPSTQTTAAFTFTSEPGARFECRLDGAAFSSCSSPVTFLQIAEGIHTFEVRARDAAGNLNPTPATYSWLVDLTTPEPSAVRITATPVNPTTQTTATFTFSAADASSSLECSLDGVAFSPCASPKTYSVLAEGSHTFKVQARDAAGNLDPTPAAYSWLIDLTAPETRIIATPPNRSNQAHTIFVFTATEVVSSFECRLDGAAFSPCSSPKAYAALIEGSHTFEVRARDAAGNLDPTPVNYSWTLDLTAPETSIIAKPPNSTAQTTAAFTFTSEPDASFECCLDGAVFSPCSSPKVYHDLAEGTHTFAVRARDGVGNLASASATYSWDLDLTAPETIITATPPNPTNQTTAAFAFTSEPSASFECRLDGAAFEPCTSPKAYPNLAEGLHTFAVRARDKLGNLASVQVPHSWILDLKAPETSIIAAPADLTNQTKAAFVFISTEEQGGHFECSLDKQPFSGCFSPQVYSSLGAGRHTFRVRAKDAAGNTDSSWASHTWSIDLTVDTEAPKAPVLQVPMPGEKFFTSSPGFSGTAEPYTTVTLFIDGSEAGSTQADEHGVWNAMPSFELTWGAHHVSVNATDRVGNIGERSSEVPFATSRRGPYGMGCSASPASWLAAWPWVLLPLLGLRRRRSRPAP
jgi:hypothetical protein